MIQITAPATGERFDDIQRQVDRQFPAGRFVAVEKGVVVADAQTHGQLVEEIRSQGKSLKDMLVIQAGVEYPASAIIFTFGSAGPSHA
ncbi:MAG: hypothetical protein L0211_07985 [Planctomycetaceae bacterium]|nr:hypothetical protein [Planctomycetaceae bacterium]